MFAISNIYKKKKLKNSEFYLSFAYYNHVGLINIKIILKISIVKKYLCKYD